MELPPSPTTGKQPTQDLIILVDLSEVPPKKMYGPASGNLASALKANAPILATKSLWKMAWFADQDNSVHTASKNWDIYEPSDEFYLFIPKNFAQANTIFKLDASLPSTKITLKATKKTPEEAYTAVPELKSTFNKIDKESIIKVLNTIIAFNGEKGPLWNIYLMGHGWYSDLEDPRYIDAINELNAARQKIGYVVSDQAIQKEISRLEAAAKSGDQKAQERLAAYKKIEQAQKTVQEALRAVSKPPAGIAGMTVEAFQAVLNFFNTKVRTNIFLYESCYSGGQHLAIPYLISGVPAQLNYTVIATMLTDDIAGLVPVKFKEFFDSIHANKSFTQILSFVNPEFYKEVGGDAPLIRYPYTTWFSPQYLQKADIVTQTRVTAARLEKKPLVLSSKPVIVFMTPNIAVPVMYTHGQLIFAPESVQTLPGQMRYLAKQRLFDAFTFESITTDKGLASFLINQFLPRETTEKFSRVYFIKELKGKNDIQELVENDPNQTNDWIKELREVVGANPMIALNDLLIVNALPGSLGNLPSQNALYFRKGQNIYKLSYDLTPTAPHKKYRSSCFRI